METLEEKQEAARERAKIARSQQNKKNAGNRKRKRTRVSIKKLLVDLASHPKSTGKVRAWAIQQLLLLGGKPVQPFEESHDESETRPELAREPVNWGAKPEREAVPLDERG
jgi:hypothetical protein